MQHCKSAATPMKLNEKLEIEDGTGKMDARVKRLVGKLLYLTHTCLDICYNVGILSRFMSSPSKQHFRAGKRLLRYLSGTTSHGLWYSYKTECESAEYTNSDWGRCMEDRRSTSWMIFSLGSSVVSWASKKQEITALSTIEDKYVASTAVACQADWLRRILADCGFK